MCGRVADTLGETGRDKTVRQRLIVPVMACARFRARLADNVACIEWQRVPLPVPGHQQRRWCRTESEERQQSVVVSPNGPRNRILISDRIPTHVSGARSERPEHVRDDFALAIS